MPRVIMLAFSCLAAVGILVWRATRRAGTRREPQAATVSQNWLTAHQAQDQP